MNKTSSDQWLLYLVRGIFVTLFGILTLIIPEQGFVTLVIILGGFMIADGLLSVLFSPVVQNKRRNQQWLLLISGAGILIAALTYFDSFIAMIALLSLFILWSFFSGIKQMLETTNSRGRNTEGWYILTILLCILIAMLMLTNPFAGTVTLSAMFGLYSLVTGIVLVFLAFRYKARQGRRRYRNVAHYR
ncbi:MAG TPA: DUF308 domain-containing protein [Chitinophagaceae bacterium]